MGVESGLGHSGFFNDLVDTCGSIAIPVKEIGRRSQDPVSRWFESEYAYGDFKGRSVELVGLVVAKLYS